MKKLLLLMNPCAGQKKGRKHLAEIIAIFNRAGYDLQCYMSAAPGELESVVHRCAAESDLLVCCGGDGTVNECVSGLIKSGRNVPLGYIPAGSTNDFASTLHLSPDLLQACRDIVEGEQICLDVGRFGERYFTYVASFGLFSKTSYATSQELKNIFGRLAYFLSGIQELSQLRSYPVRIRFSDGSLMEDKFIFGAVCNSTSVGGILNFSADTVDLCDGKFELLLARAPKDPAELRDCVLALRKQSFDSPMLYFKQVDSLEIQGPEDFPWSLDGEKAIPPKLIQISCLPSALQFYIPRAALQERGISVYSG
ncbi:MAG: diacylglycerol kinase family lipid kinase [Bacillota bacterium]|nr:diacylglycerol kinase family lipid kinase [Bacillota bacterium]